MQDSPPPESSAAVGPAESLDTDVRKPAPQKKPEKVLFGVRAKPLKVVAKKKAVLPDQAVATAVTNGHSQASEQQSGDPAPAESNGNGANAGGMLGLGSYGSESD